MVTRAAENVNENLIMNTKKPPFDNLKVRLAVSHAIDRRALNQAVHQGGAAIGVSMPSQPWGVWGVPEKDLTALPGYGKPADEKAKAKKLMAEAGYTPDKPLKVEIVTRAIAVYVDMASFIINELKQIGIEATLKQIETAQWHAMATRGEYQIGANLTGIGIDDPDANFYENFACGSPRNYTFYCNEQIGAMIDQQSAEIDPKKRLALVWEIQKKLEEEAARPTLDLARRQLHALAAGEEPDPAQQLLQLRPHAGSVARQVAGGLTARREDLHRAAAGHRRPHAVRDVGRHLRAPAAGARATSSTCCSRRPAT